MTKGKEAYERQLIIIEECTFDTRACYIYLSRDKACLCERYDYAHRKFLIKPSQTQQNRNVISQI